MSARVQRMRWLCLHPSLFGSRRRLRRATQHKYETSRSSRSHEAEGDGEQLPPEAEQGMLHRAVAHQAQAHELAVAEGKHNVRTVPSRCDDEIMSNRGHYKDREGMVM